MPSLSGLLDTFRPVWDTNERYNTPEFLGNLGKGVAGIGTGLVDLVGQAASSPSQIPGILGSLPGAIVDDYRHRFSGDVLGKMYDDPAPYLFDAGAAAAVAPRAGRLAAGAIPESMGGRLRLPEQGLGRRMVYGPDKPDLDFSGLHNKFEQARPRGFERPLADEAGMFDLGPRPDPTASLLERLKSGGGLGDETGAIRPGAEVGRDPRRFYDDLSNPPERVQMPQQHRQALLEQVEEADRAIDLITNGQMATDDLLRSLPPEERAAFEMVRKRRDEIVAELTGDQALTQAGSKVIPEPAPKGPSAASAESQMVESPLRDLSPQQRAGYWRDKGAGAEMGSPEWIESKLRQMDERGTLVKTTQAQESFPRYRKGDVESAGNKMLGRETKRLREEEFAPLVEQRKQLTNAADYLKRQLQEAYSKGGMHPDDLAQGIVKWDELITQIDELNDLLPWSGRTSLPMGTEKGGVVGVDDIEAIRPYTGEGGRRTTSSPGDEAIRPRLDVPDPISGEVQRLMVEADKIKRAPTHTRVKKADQPRVDRAARLQKDVRKTGRRRLRRERIDRDTAPMEGGPLSGSKSRRRSQQSDPATGSGGVSSDISEAYKSARVEVGRRPSAAEIVDASGGKLSKAEVRNWMKSPDAAEIKRTLDAEVRGGTSVKAEPAPPATPTSVDNPAAEALRKLGFDDAQINDILRKAPNAQAKAKVTDAGAKSTRRRSGASSEKMPSQAKLTATRKRLRTKLGRNPSAAEIADAAGVESRVTIREIRNWLKEQPRIVE